MLLKAAEENTCTHSSLHRVRAQPRALWPGVVRSCHGWWCGLGRQCGRKAQMSSKRPVQPIPSTATECLVLSKMERACRDFWLTNGMQLDVAGNRHSTEIINKHFVSNLWIFNLFWSWQQDISFMLFHHSLWEHHSACNELFTILPSFMYCRWCSSYRLRCSNVPVGVPQITYMLHLTGTSSEAKLESRCCGLTWASNIATLAAHPLLPLQPSIEGVNQKGREKLMDWDKRSLIKQQTTNTLPVIIYIK